MSTKTLGRPRIVYPETDGQPIAENTKQFRWIVTIKEGLDVYFRNNPEVFVVGDLLWYPVEGNPAIRAAPDALVVFGRPKGDRGSYLQWEEGGIAPQVVFEVLSPGNRFGQMLRKFQFYDMYGVEEYYIYDPDENCLEGMRRIGGSLQEIEPIQGWTSPRLGIRFDWSSEGLRLIRPDGRAFETFDELDLRAEVERQRAEAERQRAEAERQRAEAERARADLEGQRAERLAARLRAMGIEPEDS